MSCDEIVDISLKSEDEAFELGLSIQSDRSVVKSARFTSNNESDSTFLSVFCDLIEGIPLIEAVEHAYAYLPLLTGSPLENTTKGILFPESCNSVIYELKKLMKKLFDIYSAKTGYNSQGSTFYLFDVVNKDDNLPIKEIVFEIISNYLDIEFSLSHESGSYKFTLISNNKSNSKELSGKSLMDTEKLLQDKLKKPIELFFEQERDSNISRKRVAP